MILCTANKPSWAFYFFLVDHNSLVFNSLSDVIVAKMVFTLPSLYKFSLPSIVVFMLLISWSQLGHSVQVENAEPEHDHIEGEEGNAKEARGITFARICCNVNASPSFLANIVILFPSVNMVAAEAAVDQNILVVRLHWFRSLEAIVHL